MIQVAFCIPVSSTLDILIWFANLEVLWILQPFLAGSRTSRSCIGVSSPISAEIDIYNNVSSKTRVAMWLRHTKDNGHVDEKLAERVTVCRKESC